MKLSILPSMFLILLAACNSPVKQSQNNKKEKPVAKFDITKNAEYLNWDSVELNGTIPMISYYKDVVSKLGKPDSVGKLTEGVNGSYYHKKFQSCYFKGALFEKYHDTLVFSKIDFRNSTSFFLTKDKLRFDNLSTSSYFKKHFPYSYKNNELHGTSMDKYEYISLPVSHNKTDDNWIFTFDIETGKLLTIDHDDAFRVDTDK